MNYIFHWNSMFRPVPNNTKRIESNSKPINYFSISIGALCDEYFRFGLDLSPDCHRGDIWTEDQKVALVDSIFCGIDIGSIILAEKQWYDKTITHHEEVVDGKQRITAIIDFISGKFKFNGLYYHELHQCDRDKFDSQQINIGMMNFEEDYDRQVVLETFIRVNSGGTQMDRSVIEAAKSNRK